MSKGGEVGEVEKLFFTEKHRLDSAVEETRCRVVSLVNYKIVGMLGLNLVVDRTLHSLCDRMHRAYVWS